MNKRNEDDKMKHGKLIVMEGSCDGVGKSTQIELLRKRLLKEGYNVLCHHFPSYDLYQGRGVEEFLKGTYGAIKDLSPYFINNLYAYDRMITWQTILKKAYDDGYIILLDRYTTSSLIYQTASLKGGKEKETLIDEIATFEYDKLGTKKPDKVIFLNVSYTLNEEMRKKRNADKEEDIIEQNEKYLHEVYESALYTAKYLNWTPIMCAKDDKLRTVEEIHEDIYKNIKDLLDGKKE